MPNSAGLPPPSAPRARVRFPLSAKIVLWFLGTLLFLAMAGLIFVREQFRFGLDSLLAGPANDRLQAMAHVIVAELIDRPPEQWSAVLQRSAGAYQVQLGLVRADGSLLAGELPAIAPEVKQKLLAGLGPPRPPGDPRPRGPRPRREPGDDPERQPENGPPGPHPIPAPFPKLLLRAGTPPLYWVLIRVPLPDFPRRPFVPATLVVASASLRGGGLLFDYRPWLLGGGTVLAISVLLWLPLVRGITGTLRQMTAAAEAIAQGRFETQLPTRRRDELGRLASALNDMAARLREFFTGQRRFLGDIAHELCSPLARMELALGVLEQRADEKQRIHVADVREELVQMSALVNELLSFSKEGAGGRAPMLRPVPLAALVERVLAREAANAPVEVAIGDDSAARADPDLLARAFGNVIRNAVRYAGDAGPIRVAAEARGGEIALIVTDRGPGVPEATLHRLCDPFYRPETARTRETGGVGLGLAIVKSCVEACGGRVALCNVLPSGLQVELLLPIALASTPTPLRECHLGH